MASEDAIKVAGLIVEALPNNLFRVELPNGHQVLAHVARQVRLDSQRMAAGDRVMIKMSPFDLSKGCITSCGI